MIVNIMMLIAMYPMMMIVCYVMYTSMKPKNGMAFGCTVSLERLKDESIKEIERQWAAEMKRNTIITAVFPFAAFFTRYTSIQITIWCVWTFVLIVLMEIPFIKANAKVKEVKRAMGWYDKEKIEEYIELKAAGEVRRVKTGTFLVPFVVAVLAVILVYGASFMGIGTIQNPGYIQGFGIVIIMFALLNLLFLLAARWMDNQKTEVISTHSDVNINYTRAKKNIWKDFWIQSSWITTAYTWVCAVCLIMDFRFDLAVLAGCIVYSLAVVVLLFPVMRRLKEVEKRYENERDIVSDSDDDRYWVWGIFYNNPSDKHTMVTMRNGMGTTINAATKAGKIWWFISVIGILSVPVLCGWIIFEEFTPISLSIKDDELHAEHLKLEYEFSVEEIKDVEMVEELPNLTKAVGSAMDTLAKGSFRIKGTGEKCILFLNPENEKFLKFEVEGQVYYMSGLTDEETEIVYELLK